MEQQYTHQDTQAKQDRFLEALSEQGNVRSACLASGVHRQSVYSWLRASSSFHTRKKEAEMEYTQWLEGRLHDMIQDPKTPKSAVVALIFSLRAHLPNKYRDTVVDTTERLEASELIALLRQRRDAPATTAIDQANAIIQAGN